MSIQQPGIATDTQQAQNRPTSAAVGFTLIWEVDEGSTQRAREALRKAIRHFDDLKQLSIELGSARLEIWGRNELSNCYQHLPDGSLLVNIGTPMSVPSWQIFTDSVLNDEQPDHVDLGGNGRYVYLRISSDGNSWMLWNDWVGSMPVYHSKIEDGLIVTTLEPVVVAAVGFSVSDIYLPSLISLLVHGHYMSDWTQFKQIKVIPPDCIAKWERGEFKWKQFYSVKPSDAKWDLGWDELVEDMHEIVIQAISDVLKEKDVWIMPLTGGLDSRLIAAVGAELNSNMFAYTFGSSSSRDVIYAREIARTLGIPWKQIDLGNDYLVDYAQLWADLFGSSMHFHGMHQIPFYQELASEQDGSILSGFIGESLAGYDVNFQTQFFSSDEKRYQTHPDNYTHWPVDQLQRLLKVSIGEALEIMAAEIQKQIDIVDGPWFQRLRFLNLWGRQRHFTYFQSMLCDYLRGVATPYLNKDYARFCLSLPRAVLDDRRLQASVFVRYYPKLASIPMTYSNTPLSISGRYLIKRRVARLLPQGMLMGPLVQFNSQKFEGDVDCVRKHGWQSFWPIKEVWNRLDEWMNVDILEEVYRQAMNGSLKAVRQLQSVQALAYRLMHLN